MKKLKLGMAILALGISGAGFAVNNPYTLSFENNSNGSFDIQFHKNWPGCQSLFPNNIVLTAHTNQNIPIAWLYKNPSSKCNFKFNAMAQLPFVSGFGMTAGIDNTPWSTGICEKLTEFNKYYCYKDLPSTHSQYKVIMIADKIIIENS